MKVILAFGIGFSKGYSWKYCPKKGRFSRRRRKALKLLEDRILRDGKLGEGEVLKVDSFLNHQIDVRFLSLLGAEFRRRYAGERVDKILTIEASGIGIACLTAEQFGCPVVFAKKTKTINIYADVYRSEVYSYTHGQSYEVIVSKEFLHEGEHILIIDDFLAMGSALRSLLRLVRDAGAIPIGAGIVVEKAFQPGGTELRAQGFRIESLARIASMSHEKGITFCTD